MASSPTEREGADPSGAVVAAADEALTFALLEGQKRALELALDGAPLAEVLEVLVRTVETQSHAGLIGSILLLDPDGVHLRHGAAPNLPEAYNTGIDGVVIGPAAGSCGTAAHTGETVIVTDIAVDPLWVDYRDLALPHGLRACWSTPILSAGRGVLGTFALYYGETRGPTAREREVAGVLARTAAIILTRDRDMREGIEVHRRLGDSEERFRDLADNIAQLAWMADATGARFWYNRRWFDYTGTTLEEVEGLGWTRCHHPDELPRVMKRLRRSWETGEPWEDTFPLRGADGEYRWFLSRALPIRDKDGRIVRWFGTNTDVTEQREQEKALAQAKLAAERASRAKDEFLAILAHELRNPLAPITTALELARLRGEETPGERDVIQRQVTHLVRLVDDLLDLSRISSGKVDLHREPVELADVVAKALEMSGPLIEQKRHRLDVDVPRSGLVVDGDPTRLAQIVSNLLNNAAKYTDPGGSIRVVAGRDRQGVVLRVRDTGIGLSPEMIARVFHPFEQEAQVVDRAQGGLGLGLTIVRNLLMLHGGTVEARSAGRGAGSEFVVTLPWCSQSVRGAQDSRADALLRGPAAVRALVVDDNADAAELVVEILRAMGHDARAATDGRSALEVAAALRPDVALLDIGLPVMDGYELAAHMRRLPGLSSVRLVAITGYGQDSDRLRSREAGFDAHLVKPVSIHALAQVIADLSPRAG